LVFYNETHCSSVFYQVRFLNEHEFVPSPLIGEMFFFLLLLLLLLLILLLLIMIILMMLTKTTMTKTMVSQGVGTYC